MVNLPDKQLPSSRARWDTSAGAYDRFERRWHYYGRVAEKLVRPLGIQRDSRVLELASGTGACTLVLSGRCPEGELVCVERSPEMLRIAKRNLRNAGGNNITFVGGDVVRLSGLVRGKFDFVVCNSAFWQFPELPMVLRAIRSVLKPGGTLAFNVPQWHSTRRERQEYRKIVDKVLLRHKIDPLSFWTRRKPVDLPSLMKDCGFVLVRDTHYSVALRARERREWLRIPAFAGRLRPSSGIPSRVSAEIRRELRERRRRPWPEGRVEKRKWRLIVARSPSRGS